MGSNLQLIFGLIGLIAAFTIAGVQFSRRAKISKRLLSSLGPLQIVKQAPRGVALIRLVDSKLSSSKLFAALAKQLQIIASTSSAAKYISDTLIFALGLSVIGFWVQGFLGFITVFMLAVGIRSYSPMFQVSRRRAKFEDQFDFTLSLFSASIRTGHSLIRAVEIVTLQSEAPTSQEFSRALNSMRLGRDIGDSLLEIAERMKSQELEWVVQSINIHRESGGNLNEMFETVVATIKDRGSIRVMVRTLSTDGRVSGQVMSMLPVGIILFFGLQRPESFAVLLSTQTGNILLAIAIVLYITGVVWIQRIIKVRF